MDLGLQGKVVLVTGGASGIGAGIARLFCEEAANVALIDRDEGHGHALAQELRAAGKTACFVHADLCDFENCQRAVADTIAHFGRLDVVINNAGVNDVVGVRAGPQALEASLRRNLTHCYTMVHYAVDQLQANRGAIVNVSSKVSVTGQGGTSGYAAAKGAINALTREWAAEFAEVGVRVNTVVPAEVWTPMYEKWLEGAADPLAERRRIEASIPLGRRFTQVDEIATVVVFLASRAASHVTGQIVHVDGGYVHLDRRLTS